MMTFFQVRDSHVPGHVHAWAEHVDDGRPVHAEPLCDCPRGHKTPDAARACKRAAQRRAEIEERERA